MSVLFFLIAFLSLTLYGESGGNAGLATLFMYVPLFWFIWAQGAKRCHDRNNSGWYQAIPFYSLWMLFAEGDYEDNHYGSDPKGFNAETIYAN